MNTITRITRTTGEPDQRFAEEPKQTITLRLAPSFRREVEALARRRGIKRTTVIEEALRFYLAVKKFDELPQPDQNATPDAPPNGHQP